MATTPLTFTKAQATGNDFVMIADATGSQKLDAALVEKLCDRHMGVGADGLIRAVPAHQDTEAGRLLAETGLTSSAEAPLWFMDYRNADGSIAEMCGNGVRAFAHFLINQEAVDPDAESIPVLTRAGIKTVRQVSEGYAVGMGVWSFIDPEMAADSASDSLVQTPGQNDPRPALSISMGNPHTVVALPNEQALENLDLHTPPKVEPNPPQGTNVEFVVPADPLIENGEGRVRMRVHERGVGETMSCGTGACAAAAAVRVWAAGDGVDTWRVAVPGGEVTIRFTSREDGAEDVELAGPAELVYTGELLTE